MKLSIRAAGLSVGLLWGFFLFVLTLGAHYFGFYRNQLYFLFDGVYPGYSISFEGAFVGLLLGFLDGFLGGMILAWLYNRMVGCFGNQDACCCESSPEVPVSRRLIASTRKTTRRSRRKA